MREIDSHDTAFDGALPQERPTGQMRGKRRSFSLQMVVDGNRPCARGEGARRAARLLSIALALLAVATQPARASTVRMVCLVVDLEGDGLRLGDRHYPVPFDVDGDGLRETVQWTAEEQREEAGPAQESSGCAHGQRLVCIERLYVELLAA